MTETMTPEQRLKKDIHNIAKRYLPTDTKDGTSLKPYNKCCQKIIKYHTGKDLSITQIILLADQSNGGNDQVNEATSFEDNSKAKAALVIIGCRNHLNKLKDEEEREYTIKDIIELIRKCMDNQTPTRKTNKGGNGGGDYQGHEPGEPDEKPKGNPFKPRMP